MATKIMLGVFGNVPAFDRHVVAGLRADGLVGRFGLRALQAIGRYYQRNADLIEQERLRTLDFETGSTHIANTPVPRS
jgi:murein L,D-transpeptidase YcbB/YkuD